MFPGDQVSALQDYLKSRGRGEAVAPPALARTQGNRDGLSGIDPAALESAFRAVRAAVAMAATADLLPHRVRRDLLRDRRRMSRLLLDEIKLEATTVEERVALVRDIGPRDILKLLIETLEKKGLMAWSGVAGILRVHIGSAELRRGLTEALQSNDPKVLAEKLADLYRQHQGALIWDEKALVVTLRS